MPLVREHALSSPRRPSVRRRAGSAGLAPGSVTPIIVTALAVAAAILAADWIAAAGIFVLWLIWHLLTEDGEPPVLPLALSFQWVQVTCGVYYLALSGRELEAHFASDYRPMVLIGLGCVSALTIGLAIGLKAARSRTTPADRSGPFAVSWRTLLIAYVVSSMANAVFRQVAWAAPGLVQALLALGFIRIGVLFLIFRRLVRNRFRWEWFFGFLLVELILGFTGYFASFREPLILAAVALLEVFRPRSALHWLRIIGVAALMGAAGLMWIGIRSVYRAEIDTGELDSRVERLGRVGELSSEWFGSELSSFAGDMDRLADRMWTIYYPALAVERVPDILPHENGAILLGALKHIVTPRLLFPNKGILPSDSEMVRQYSGIYVASTEEGTSIAFGYAGESYIDFGLPWMFLPSLFFGILMGLAYRAVFRVIYHHELAMGLACVVFWLSLYLFERSWIKTLGTTLTLLLAVGAVVFVLDRAILRRRARARFRGSASLRRRSRLAAPRAR